MQKSGKILGFSKVSGRVFGQRTLCYDPVEPCYTCTRCLCIFQRSVARLCDRAVHRAIARPGCVQDRPTLHSCTCSLCLEEPTPHCATCPGVQRLPGTSCGGYPTLHHTTHRHFSKPDPTPCAEAALPNSLCYTPVHSGLPRRTQLPI